MVFLVAAVMALPGAAHSAMWVGGELGGNFPGNTKINVDGQNLSGSTNFDPSVIGGVTIGYDFVNSGFGAYAWPSWMQYFSFAMDLTYNRLNVKTGTNGLGAVLPLRSQLSGYEVAWTFLFMAHYGFFPDSEVPSGRVNPYIGVGPAILWSGIDAGSLGVGSASATNVALVVEPGIRWVLLSNVSVDTAFRYRYAVPSWDLDNDNVKANPLHQYTFLIRANYHF